MNKLFTLTTAAAMTLFFSSCVSNLSAPNRPSSAAPAVSPAERVIAERVYALINNEREASGKKMMRGHHGLNALAQMHSLYMCSTLSDANHFGSENRAQYADLKYSIENLSEMTYVVYGASEDPAAEAVEAWINTPSYRMYMLQSWDLTGVGVETLSGGETYITMCMGAQPLGAPRSISPLGWQ
jgi:uncharacterized protein YkwD